MLDHGWAYVAVEPTCQPERGPNGPQFGESLAHLWTAIVKQNDRPAQHAIERDPRRKVNEDDDLGLLSRAFAHTIDYPRRFGYDTGH